MRMIQKTISSIIIFIFLTLTSYSQGSITATYAQGDIPTSDGTFDPGCNGPLSTLEIILPAGENVPVDSITISYNIQSGASHQPDWQASQIHCQNNNTTEPVYNGSSTTLGGVETYNRSNVDIANGIYAGGTKLIFEIRSWRTAGGQSGCQTDYQKVANGTWNITVYYGAAYTTPKVGVNTNTPMSVLDVNGKIKVGDDYTAPIKGNIRWNENESDFQGFNGQDWLSFTSESNNEPPYTSKIDQSNLPVHIMPTGTISDTMGIIYDSGGPNSNYQDNEDFIQYILSMSGSIGVKITIDSLNVEQGYDTLTIQNDHYSLNCIDCSIVKYYPNDNLLINFKSDHIFTRSGFKITYEHLFLAPNSNDTITSPFSAWKYFTEKTAVIGGFHNPSEVQQDSLGISSITFGSLNRAKGDYSVSFGKSTLASGIGATAMGADTKAAGDYSHASGSKTIASGFGSQASGHLTEASGYGSHTSGDRTIASGYNSQATGTLTIVSGDYSQASGVYSNANGNYTQANGNATNASGDYSRANGKGTVSSGDYSQANGNNTTASGNYSVTNGMITSAQGLYSHANGTITNASGDYSHAHGAYADASGDYSRAYGVDAVASGAYSQANGNNTIASGIGSFSLGKYNVSGTNKLFEIGDGTSNTARSNIFTVLQNGNIGTNNIDNPLASLHVGYQTSLSWDAHLRLEYTASQYGNIIYDFDGFKFRTFGSGDHVYFRNSANAQNCILYDNGNAFLRGALTQNSDKRLKKNIVKLSNSLVKVNSINAYNYLWKDKDRDQNIQTGFIAQELQEVFPELVSSCEDGMLSVNYIAMIPHLLESIKTLTEENEEIKSELAALKSTNNVKILSSIAELQAEINSLKEVQETSLSRE